ncbi:hypothetical protein P9112_009024 [Eukaryota sp. TZLM1-RC]
MKPSQELLSAPSVLQDALMVQVHSGSISTSAWCNFFCQLKEYQILCWKGDDDSENSSIEVTIPLTYHTSISLQPTPTSSSSTTPGQFISITTEEKKPLYALAFETEDCLVKWINGIYAIQRVFQYKRDSESANCPPCIKFISFLRTFNDFLDLSSSILPVDSISIISTFLKNSLQSIILDNCSLNNESLALFCERFPDFYNLSYLSLSNNNISREGVVFLVDSLLSTCISSLILDNNPIGDPGIVEIAEVLPCLNIKSLSLANCQISCVGIESLSVYLTDSMVSSLNLSFNLIKSDGLLALGCVLNCTIPLEILYLESISEIEDSALETFIKSLTSANLKELYIGGNHFSLPIFNTLSEVACGSTLTKASLINKDSKFGSVFGTNIGIRNLLTVGFKLEKFCLKRS